MVYLPIGKEESVVQANVVHFFFAQIVLSLNI